MHEEEGNFVQSALGVKMNIIFLLNMFVNIA